MTQDDRDYRLFRIGWIRTLCASFEQEHDWDNDEDPGANRECLAECRALAQEMEDAVPQAEPVPVIAEQDELPF